MKKVNNQDSVNIISNVYHRPNQENWPDGYNHRYGQKTLSSHGVGSLKVKRAHGSFIRTIATVS